MDISVEVLKKIQDLMDASHLVLSRDAVLEVYHHLGTDNFERVGATFIKVVNREYCKSYAILLPNQAYPSHYHKIKQETFFVLYGKLEVERDEQTYLLLPGESLSIERGQTHSFSTVEGAVFEEISTTYVQNDSVYENEKIGLTTYKERKTLITLKELQNRLHCISEM